MEQGRMRAIPTDFDAAILARIDDNLARIRADDRVVLPLVVESGSRAWGFPSLDSDYDVRFIFVRPLAEYLTPWPRRDVIETPISDDLDINGWDLGKTVKLLLNGNAVVVEWLMSPIIYASDEAFRSELTELARRVAGRDRIARHYLHLGESQMRRSFADDGTVAQKRIFYVMRPAAALRWLRLHPTSTIAPMHFPTLLAGCEPPADVAGIVTDLMARKAVTRELGTRAVPAVLLDFLVGEFALARDAFSAERLVDEAACRRDLEAFFRATVGRLADDR